MKPNDDLKLVGHPAQDFLGEAIVDPSVGLPLSDAGVDAVSSAYAVKELLE